MYDGNEQPGVIQRALSVASRNRTPLIVGVIALVLGGLLLNVLLNTAHQPPVKQVQTVTIVPVQPPKPPPPPPPPPPTPKMITPDKTPQPDVKPMTPNQPPKAAPPKPAGPAAPALGTSIKGPGADAFNLSGSVCTGVCFGNGGGGGGGGSYAGQVDAAIAEALQQNPVTRNASAGLEVDIYVDPNLVITRVVIVKSSGNPQVDNAVENQVLPGLQLPAAPPGEAKPMYEMQLTGQSPL